MNSNSNVQIQKTDNYLKKFSEKHLSEFCEDRRNQVFRTTKHETENFHRVFELVGPRRLKLKECYILGILHWYFPDEIRYLVNLYLYENWTEHDLVEKEVILSSKKNMLGWIHTQEKFTMKHIFSGIIHKQNLKSVNKLKIKSYLRSSGAEKSDKRYSGWCRGPKDKGSTSSADFENVRQINDYKNIIKSIEDELEFKLLLEQALEKIKIFYEAC